MAAISLEHAAGNLGAPRPPKLRGGMPVLGHIRAMLRDPYALFLRGYREHGPVYRCNLGGKDYVILAGVEANAWLTRYERDFITAAGIYDAISVLFNADPGVVMTNVDGKRHSELRAQMKNGMSRSYLEQRIELCKGVSNEFFDQATGGDDVDATEWMKLLVYEQLGHTLAGEAPAELYHDYQHMLDVIIRSVVLPWTRYLPKSPRTRAAIRRLDAFGERLRQRQGTDPEGAERLLIDDLFAGIESGTYGRDDLRMLLTAPYVAGLDTLAHSLAFAIYGILANPEVKARVLAELDEKFDPQNATPADLKQLEVTRNAIMESMRLYPISPGQRRRIKADVVVGGVQLRAGDDVIVPHALSHFQDEVYPEAARFDIDRFAKERGEHRRPGAFQPYGVGPHICLGAGMADVQLLINVANLFKRFDVAFADDYRLRVQWLPTGHPLDMHLQVRPRRVESRAQMPAAAVG